MILKRTKMIILFAVLDTGAFVTTCSSKLMYNCPSESTLIRHKVETMRIGGSVLSGKEPLYYRMPCDKLCLIGVDGRNIEFPYCSVWVTFDKRVNKALLGMDYLQLLNITYLSDMSQLTLSYSNSYSILYKYMQSTGKKIFRKPEKINSSMLYNIINGQ